MARDLRICFVGDSFVAGVGDPRCLGWVGRLGPAAMPFTGYNLGVRRETSADIVARWQAECTPRLPEGTDARVVFSFGVNDTVLENGSPRVDPGESVANLTNVLAVAAERGWQTMVVAPPPVDDDAHNVRIAHLDERFAEICAGAGTPYARVHHELRANEVWMREVREGDGAHPGAAGYDAIAALIMPVWLEWLSR
ncbi:GDSL-type esterase/lipase family protein [Nocardia bhagyanarayanae]|uniref:Lysophospholipase L1-like esterase n=1 Tax=Nocardia bhagyanarayanae TaxID=1215925 RepID=A0A543F777_9NOCA|nr:GDSL-type esterase/lipase family protein [Nocardia bhagyanarayanae]TQM29687.1 lysophospholipase L1-like esterase [Nocardia bhagyanarayanae]